MVLSLEGRRCDGAPYQAANQPNRDGARRPTCAAMRERLNRLPVARRQARKQKLLSLPASVTRRLNNRGGRGGSKDHRCFPDRTPACAGGRRQECGTLLQGGRRNPFRTGRAGPTYSRALGCGPTRNWRWFPMHAWKRCRPNRYRSEAGSCNSPPGGGGGISRRTPLPGGWAIGRQLAFHCCERELRSEHSRFDAQKLIRLRISK